MRILDFNLGILVSLEASRQEREGDRNQKSNFHHNFGQICLNCFKKSLERMESLLLPSRS